MVRGKPYLIERGEDSFCLSGVSRRRPGATQGGDRYMEAATGLRTFVFRLAILAAFSALAFVGWSTEISRAQETDFGVFARAVEYCRGDVQRPMALDLGKRVLCFDGVLSRELDVSFAGGLQQNGLFVVRSPGGDILSATTLADFLRDRNASVVIYDYCLSACASYLLMATNETFVIRDTLVAWHYTADPRWCPSLKFAKDDGPKRLEKAPCPDAPSDIKEGDEYRRHLNYKFYSGRAVDPLFNDPPQSFAIRRIMRGLFEETGRYPEVFWTWNPRYYSRMLKTKIVYEAYPGSQTEVDALVARFRTSSVIYDP
jgi:hypothetical protein